MREDRCETCRYSVVAYTDGVENKDPSPNAVKCKHGPPVFLIEWPWRAWPLMPKDEWCHQWKVKLIQPEGDTGWKCSQCGTQNFNDDLPCRRCGTRVT